MKPTEETETKHASFSMTLHPVLTEHTYSTFLFIHRCHLQHIFIVYLLMLSQKPLYCMQFHDISHIRVGKKKQKIVCCVIVHVFSED
jgi:hypothetical protein